uniref:Integrase catalytic domain-containing protein n=1 Tax=Plectus sambesii TaxID=2011161 RepID=A0A914X7S0_9BILA
MKFVADQLDLPITKKILWTDSECVLHWLKSAKPLSVFVENRLSEIRGHEDVHFRYINTEENPADLSTRGVTTVGFENLNLWWNGPKWLATPMEEWPEWNLQEIQPHILQKINEETKGKTSFHEATMAVVETSNVQKQKEENPMLIDASCMSSWPKQARVTVYCLRFLKKKIWNRLRKETQAEIQKKMNLVDWKEISDNGAITSKEMKAAETFTLHQVHESQFSEVIQILRESSKKKHPLKDQLGVYLDEKKLLRCRGRIEDASLDEETKYPILLPRNNRVTELIVLHKHRQMMHGGVQQTLAEVRKEYWLLKGRSEIRKIISRQCYICRKYTARPFSLPPLPALPKERVQQSTPFEYTGLDYLGPLWVKEGGDKTKMWICLFTCLVTRAIHLEPVMDLTAQQFLNCVRRFIARRSRPRFIISDNAPQFKLVQKTLEKAWLSVLQDDTTLTYFANQQIAWRFITEYAPWQGGVYERMVGIVKQSLRKAVGRQLLSFEQMNTLLTEVEGVVNSRPLTYLYNEIHSQKILRPIDFLLPKGEIGIPSLGEQEKNDQEWLPKIDSKEKLLQFWKKSLKNLDQFWKFWHEEYLLSLREKMQTKHRGPRSQAEIFPRIGEVVLLKEEGAPRGVWKLGKIVDVTQGRGNEIRSAKIQLPNQSFLKRPINLLYPLELSDETALESVTASVVEKEETQEKRKEENQKELRRNHQILHAKKSSNAFYVMATIMTIFSLFSGVQTTSGNCVESSIEELFSKAEYLLPLTTQGPTPTSNGHKIEAEYNEIALLELQISMEGFRLSTKTEKNKCRN